MRYCANKELPARVRNRLPQAAQEVFRQAFNYAYAAYAGDAERDQRAHTIAWAAVKQVYAEDGGAWRPK